MTRIRRSRVGNGTVCLLLCGVLFIRGEAQPTDSAHIAQGGMARMLALGGDPLTYYVKDYAHLFVNPALLLDHPDLLFVETGTGVGGTGFGGSGQYVGATISLGSSYVGSIAVGKREGPFFTELSLGQASSAPVAAVDYMKQSLDLYLQQLLLLASNEPASALHLMAAGRVGDIGVGIALYRTSWSRDDEGAGSVPPGRSIHISTAQTGVKVGASMTGDGTLTGDVALSARLNTAGAEYKSATGSPTESSYDATGVELGLTGRIFRTYDEKTEIVTLIRAAYSAYKPGVISLPLPPTPIQYPNDYMKRELEGGIGMVRRMNGALVTVGFSIQHVVLENVARSAGTVGVQTTKYTQTWFDLPKVQVGAEFPLSARVVARAGYYRRFCTITTRTESTGSAATESSVSADPGFLPTFGLTAADQQLSFGIGLHGRRFSFDAYVADRLLRTGPWFLSGIQQALFGIVSLSYRL